MSIQYVPIVEATSNEIHSYHFVCVRPDAENEANKVGLVTLHKMLRLINETTSRYFPLIIDEAGNTFICMSSSVELDKAFTLGNDCVQNRNKEQPNYAEVVYRPTP